MATTPATTIEETTVLESINDADGNVSVTDADKAAAKAKDKPTITFSVNLDANYKRLEEMASKATDEKGNAHSIHSFIKYHVFHTLDGLTWTGEVLRKVGTVQSDETILATSVLAQAIGIDAYKALSPADRLRMEKVVAAAMKPTPEQLALAALAVQGGVAAAMQREAAAKLAK